MSQSNSVPNIALTKSDRLTINILILGVLLPLLDTTLINVGINTIGAELNASMSLLQWVITAYSLAAASAVPLSAWLAGKFGAKRLWLLCLWLFLIGTIISALAGNVHILIISRILQGVATGLLLPTMQTIVVNAIGKEKTRAALSSMSVPSVLAPIFGPVIGGFILQYLSWQWIFWLHLPICIAAILAAHKWLPNEKNKTIYPLDFIGFFLLSPGILFFVYGLSGINSDDTWQAWLILLGLILMIVFIWHAMQRKEFALIDIRVFATKKFSTSSALLFLSSVVYYGGILLLPLYFIQIGGYTPSLAGVLLALHGVGTLVGRHKLQAISKRWGDRKVAFVAVLLTAFGSLLLLPPQILSNSYIVSLGMIIRGAGVGILTIMSMSGAYEGLPPKQVSHASSISRIVTQLGATIGATLIAVFATSSDLIEKSENIYYGYAHIALLVVIFMCGSIAFRYPHHGVRK